MGGHFPNASSARMRGLFHLRHTWLQHGFRADEPTIEHRHEILCVYMSGADQKQMLAARVEHDGQQSLVEFKALDTERENCLFFPFRSASFKSWNIRKCWLKLGFAVEWVTHRTGVYLVRFWTLHERSWPTQWQEQTPIRQKGSEELLLVNWPSPP